MLNPHKPLNQANSLNKCVRVVPSEKQQVKRNETVQINNETNKKSECATGNP